MGPHPYRENYNKEGRLRAGELFPLEMRFLGWLLSTKW